MKSLKELLYILSFLFLLVTQIFCIGWLANDVKDQSIAIGDALYETKWYNADIRAKKLIPIIILKTQRPLTLYIGSFGPMTLEKALGILRAAYSYVTLMTNFQ